MALGGGHSRRATTRRRVPERGVTRRLVSPCQLVRLGAGVALIAIGEDGVAHELDRRHCAPPRRCRWLMRRDLPGEDLSDERDHARQTGAARLGCNAGRHDGLRTARLAHAKTDHRVGVLRGCPALFGPPSCVTFSPPVHADRPSLVCMSLQKTTRELSTP